MFLVCLHCLAASSPRLVRTIRDLFSSERNHREERQRRLGAKSADEWPVRQDRRTAKRGQRPGHARMIWRRWVKSARKGMRGEHRAVVHEPTFRYFNLEPGNRRRQHGAAACMMTVVKRAFCVWIPSALVGGADTFVGSQTEEACRRTTLPYGDSVRISSGRDRVSLATLSGNIWQAPAQC